MVNRRLRRHAPTTFRRRPPVSVFTVREMASAAFARRPLYIILLFGLMTACGGTSLDEEAITELRANDESLDEYSDDELREVATALCDGYSEAGAEEASSDSGDLIDTAWAVAGVEEVGVEEILASLELLEAACPEALTPELAADSEPIPITFTLLGTEGEEYEYSDSSGCAGLGGYGDIREGMLFNLANEQGDVLGVARTDDSEDSSIGCEISGVFSVTFGDLDDDTLYPVGDRAGERGELAYTGAELREAGSIDLSLGEP
jgi:hypothetical protein